MKNKKLTVSLSIVIVIILGVVGYLGYQNYQQKKNILTLKDELFKTETDFASTTKNLQEIIGSLEQKLSETEIEREGYKIRLQLEKEKMDRFESQISEIQGTVGDLEKLSQTDSELLEKYSKVYFLSENYIPETLTKINPQYTYDPDEDYFFHSKVWPFLENMMLAAENNIPSIDIKIISAYRSFGKQGVLKSSYLMIYGSGANEFSADQGYSEHQLGTTVDFTTSEVGASFSDFEKTPAYQWLLNNAYRYGFILSYPENNQYYQFEPWHWRFVGRELAEKLRQENKYFYDLSQREIDQYLISFFD